MHRLPVGIPCFGKILPRCVLKLRIVHVDHHARYYERFDRFQTHTILDESETCSLAICTVYYRIRKLTVLQEVTMAAVARFDLKMDAEEKDVVSRAAALVGTTMAAFVRTAAKEKARELLDRESRITMSAQDFQAFTMALDGTFTPNVALQNALNVAQKVRRV